MWVKWQEVKRFQQMVATNYISELVHKTLQLGSVWWIILLSVNAKRNLVGNVCVFHLIYSLTLLRATSLDLLVSDVSIKLKFKKFHKSVFPICINWNFTTSKIKSWKELLIALNRALNILFNRHSFNAGSWKHWLLIW